MHVSVWSVLLCLLFGTVLFSPIGVGAFDVSPYAFVALVLLAFATYAFARERPRVFKQAALVPLSVCFALTLFDLASRPLLSSVFEVRPTDRFIYRWPPLPQLHRYVAGVNFQGNTYGDLAFVSGRKDWRTERRIKFVTDAYGFRNELPGVGVAEGPLDVIVLGDSFGVSGGTSQEEILSSRLARDYGLKVYNLSISRETPQQQYANLALEGGRLTTRKGTLVLWLIFPGNDLDEPYYPELENPRLSWPGPLTQVVNTVSDFRARSTVHRLLTRGDSDLVIERKFIDSQRMLFFQTYAQRRGRTTEDVTRHPNYAHFELTLSAMAKLAGEKELTVAIALVPSKEEVYSWVLDGAPPWSSDQMPSGFSAVTRELSDRHGFRFLDLQPALREASRRAYEKSGLLLWWRDDSHWNGEGQRVAAEAVYENLLRGSVGLLVPEAGRLPRRNQQARVD